MTRLIKILDKSEWTLGIFILINLDMGAYLNLDLKGFMKCIN
jgi:hypothetical protein